MNGDPTGLSIRSPESQDRREPPFPPSELLLRHRRPGCERMESSAEEEAATAASCPSPLDDDTVRAENRQPEGRSASTDVDRFRQTVDEYSSKVDELEERVKDVAQLFASAKQPSNLSPGIGGVKKQMDGCRKEFVCTKRMQELMRQFGTILKQISQHKWAWPFLEPVDVEGLGLHDYHEVIKKPMDFSTIRNQMDDSGYKHVREIYADVRLVFTNAMTYNNEKNDVHVMAKTLLDKFEERWLMLLPKVVEEETRQEEEDAQDQVNTQLAREAAIQKLHRDTDNELVEVIMNLKKFRERVILKCRKISAYEKRKLGVELSYLSPEDLERALEIVAENNPRFQATAPAAEIDLDAQSKITIWKLRVFVKKALERQARSTVRKGDENLKRKKEICDALAKTAKKRNRDQNRSV